MAAPTHYDAIVLGVGAMGSAALYHLAQRGLDVLGIEQFDIPHELGSSGGVTRIYRLAYQEHPSYVPLMRRALDLWERLQDAGRRDPLPHHRLRPRGPSRKLDVRGLPSLPEGTRPAPRGDGRLPAGGPLPRLPASRPLPGHLPAGRRLPPGRQVHRRPRRRRPVPQRRDPRKGARTGMGGRAGTPSASPPTGPTTRRSSW